MGFPTFSTTLSPLAGKLKSVDDLSLAMRWIHRLKAHKEAVEAERKRATNEVNESAASAMQIEVDGETMPLEQLEVKLLQAIEKYVPDHKAEIFKDGIQTARFPSGEVSWQDRTPDVELDEGAKKQQIADRLVKRAKLPEAFAAALDAAGLAGKVRVKWELDLATIKRLFRSGALKKSQIPAGLVVTDPSEIVVVKPYSGPERSELSE